MLQAVKQAFGQFMGRYHASIAPTTKPLESYVTRELGKAIAWAPARMIDAAEEMLWMRSDIHGAPTRAPDMPVILVALAKDYIPTGRDYTRQVTERQMVIIPSDPKERMFGLRAVAGDIRAQVVIFAMDEPTAHSLAGQFLLFLDATPNRRFMARHVFAGQNIDWPVQVELPDVPAMHIPTEAKNLTVLAIDMTLHVQIPLLDAPVRARRTTARAHRAMWQILPATPWCRKSASPARRPGRAAARPLFAPTTSPPTKGRPNADDGQARRQHRSVRRISLPRRA